MIIYFSVFFITSVFFALSCRMVGGDPVKEIWWILFAGMLWPLTLTMTTVLLLSMCLHKLIKEKEGK